MSGCDSKASIVCSMIVFPAILSSCFGMARPSREPVPPARITATVRSRADDGVMTPSPRPPPGPRLARSAKHMANLLSLSSSFTYYFQVRNRVVGLSPAAAQLGLARDRAGADGHRGGRACT